MAVITPSAKTQFIGANGEPLVGGKLYTYVAGTTTPSPTYTDNTGSTPNANPVILDARGEADVWLGESTYKFKLTDANDVEIWTVDYISAPTTALSPVLTGNVTISSDSSGPALKITQTGTGYVMRVQDSVDPDSTPFVINSSGYVGLGTAAPAEALDIDNSGKLQFSSAGTALTIISADATNSTIDVKDDRNLVIKANAATILTANDADVTSTVPVVLPGDPSSSLQAAPKQYVDTSSSAAVVSAAPAGIIAPFAGSSAPAGWLAANGAAVSRTTYAALFAAIGTTWGAGDGSTTFNLPDLRGMFLRGTGTNATGSSSGAVGPAVGGYAADAYLNHSHTASSPSHTHTDGIVSVASTVGVQAGASYSIPATFNSGSTGGTAATVTVDASTTGSTETRPKNYGILYIIKT
jgi:microcystin-dependent protein